ncbi:MAG: hypothetical protein E3J83_05730 [Candidatus Atribacteria bacterium]|nr:MAG: hypothetical protein E3J83_05730 [Candidatus Atribacteria bacterium]
MLITEGRTNGKYILIVVVLTAIVGGGIWLLAKQEVPFTEFSEINKPEENGMDVNNEINIHEYPSDSEQFRNLTIKFVREVAENYFDEQLIKYPEELGIRGNWVPYITIYHQGEIKGRGKGENEILSFALAEATKVAFSDEGCENLTKKDLKDVIFLVKFLIPPNQFSFVEYDGKGKELIGDLVVIRNLDKELIRQKIEQGKEFLYRVMNKNEYGFYKKYDALNDDFEDRLHTVYSASIIYTFLYIYDLEKDEKILEYIPDWGNFLFFMQNKDEEDERYGAFHYSYYLDSKEREKKFVVGTSALTIFTLLRLYDLTNDSKYLESAKLAGDWLTTMQKPDGSMRPYVRYSDGQWVYGDKESLLYNGQVLSALSKLFQATGDKKYYDTAEGIAKVFAEKYEKEKGYIEGEYREKNPISNSWVVMSLMDFYRVNQADYYKNIIFELSKKILESQKNDMNNLLHYGGWGEVYSTSGIGWISEVMVETYIFCKEFTPRPNFGVGASKEDCNKYKDSAIKAMRLLIQNTYSEENTFFLKNPKRAMGGVFWNEQNKYVRTDSVCHALNGYVRIINDLEDGLLLSVPEKSFEAIFNELKK